MLSRLHHGRTLRPVGEAHDAFYPQQVGAALASKAAESTGEIEPAHRAFEDHPERIDAVGVDGDRLGRHHGSGRCRAVAEQHQAGILGLGREDAVGAVVERIETADEIWTERREVGLGDHQRIGERGLPPRLGEAVETVGAIHRVDESDDPRQMQRVVEHRIGAQCEEDRSGVGKPGGFDHDPPKPPDFAGIAALEEAAQGARKVLAHRTAQASPRQFQHTTLDEIDEVMVDRDLAELVDDDSRIGEGGRDERAPQQRRFATAEKPGQHGRRQSLR